MAELISAGLLMYKINGKELRVFLVHPGGPIFKNKDEGYWGIPKGLVEVGEDLEDTAKREFEEETGILPIGKFIELGSVKQKSGKTVHAWAFENNDSIPKELNCNTFQMEWPPYSGKKQAFPEVDKGEFFDVSSARKKIIYAQEEFLDRLLEHLKETKEI
jgi:predicted NUDIX family NTP pyrophosphohydrolase